MSLLGFKETFFTNKWLRSAVELTNESNSWELLWVEGLTSLTVAPIATLGEMILYFIASYLQCYDEQNTF